LEALEFGADGLNADRVRHPPGLSVTRSWIRLRPKPAFSIKIVASAIFREWIVNVGSRDAYSRIAHLLCEIFLKLRAVGLTNGNSFDFPITQLKLGEATGLSTVHVNRSVQRLRGDGLIVLERGHCTIPDLDRLKEAGMFDHTYLHLRGEQEEAA
jgi:biotin operon repressor